MSTSPQQYKITAEKETGSAILITLENSYPEPASISHYEEPDKSWAVTVIYETPVEAETLYNLLQSALDLKPEDYQLTLAPIADIDWVAHVQSELIPVRAGRFLIHGSHDRAAARGEPAAIEIDAAQAFGTAHHGTTKGCLIAIDHLANEGLSPENILDLGTGSGILAIAAHIAWPEAHIIASDIDPIAIDVAKDNFSLNKASGITALCAANLEDETLKSAAPYQLLIANILAKPLISLADEIKAAVAPGGTLLLSGILDNQAKDVISAYTAAGLTHQSTDQFDEWVTILFTHPR